MDRIPILHMGRFLLVTIQVDMHDRLATTLQNDLTHRIVETGARGVLIDISSVSMVDSFIGRMLANIAAMSRVLDAHTVVVGMQPAVAITLVELGLSLAGVRTALDVERGMKLLERALAEEDAADGYDGSRPVGPSRPAYADDRDARGAFGPTNGGGYRPGRGPAHDDDEDDDDSDYPRGPERRPHRADRTDQE